MVESSVERLFHSGMRAILVACVLAPILLTSAVAVEAQTAEDLPLNGIVRDAVSGMPIHNARVRMEGRRGGMLTGLDGRFVFEKAGRGEIVVVVEQYGYESIEAALVLQDDTPVLDILLDPQPVMLDGISVVADRLELMEQRLTSRRRAAAVSTRAFDRERMQRSASRDLLEFLSLESSVAPEPCGRRGLQSWCVYRRGRLVQPTVYVDEARVIGGLDQLSTYRPHELYMVEVYSRGLEIRAYTHNFMERMAKRPMILIPIGVG